MSKIIKIFIFSIIAFLLPLVTFADTHVYSSDVQPDWSWNREGSPYVLEEPIYIPAGHRLTITEGVEILSATSEETQDPNSLTIAGELIVMGTDDTPVLFKDLYVVYFTEGVSSIKNAVFRGTGLDFNKSTTTIEHVTIENAFSGISAKASTINVSDSILRNNSYGVASYEDMPIFQMIVSLSGQEGIENNRSDRRQNLITLRNSSLYENTIFNVMNQTENTITAFDNWWGSPDGPESTISGLVEVNPWKVEDPNNAACCSNILFIPGIQATRLYKGNNMLWEPNRNDDVKKLSMDSKGISIDPSIKVGGIIDRALGAKNIYKGFMASMDELVKSGLLHEWLPVPYDWRLGVYDVIDTDMLNKVYALASTSMTGKITIIAHSNGGLVAKALMKKLEEVGRTHIVDKSIFVAVPELGTPQALLSMLHGNNQSIAGGLVLSENTARTFSQNVPGAYGLLPSRGFFKKNPLKVISDFFSKKTPTSVSSYESMRNFLTSNSFSKASTTDINIPIILNPYLLPSQDQFHSVFDVWKPASSTKTLSIFGWGMPTVKSISYERDAHCKPESRNCDVSVFRKVTSAGDGTVMTSTNSGFADKTLYFNLKKANDDTKKDIKHADILESPQVQEFLEDEIRGISSEKEYEKYFTAAEPADKDQWLYIRVYSPIDIHVYDKKGNHTGLLENPIVGVDLEDYENNIPSSVYDGWGRTKQVILPYDQEYEIVLRGTDTGVFTLVTEVIQSDNVIASTTFSELPVTQSTNIDFIVATSTSAFSSTTVMFMDSDGDGITETLHNSDQFLKANAKDRKYHKKFKKAIKRLFKYKLPKHR